MLIRLLARCFLATVTLVAAGCGSGGGSTPSSGDPEADRRAELRVAGSDDKGDSRTLYDRLGGEPGITAIVDDMTERVIADPRVNFDRTNVKSGWIGTMYRPWNPSPENVQRFKLHTVQFLVLAAGGPAQYSGRDMATVHKEMRITNNEFDAMVGDIKASMDRLGVGAREKKDLLAIVETTRKQIVEKQ
ncbi:MAG: group 1 truncated hemoglobin [Planctomycetes bacterium]|nr:group 1 truncated hemoglobin [Planctomycetota bacterium]